MRAETTPPAVVATVSVAVAAVGHAVAGGPVPLTAIPDLLALAAVSWFLALHCARHTQAIAGLLAAIQLSVHGLLTASAGPTTPMTAHHGHHHGHSMPPHEAGLHDGFAGIATMATVHLAALLAGVLLIDRTNHWVRRVLRIVARLVPQLPEPADVPVTARRPTVVPAVPRLVRRWLTSNVSRRGPPGPVLNPS